MHDSRAERILPLSEHVLEVAGDALEHDSRHGHERPVFHACRQDRVLLRKVERIVERRVLVLRTLANNDVHLEEGVEDVDVRRDQVRLLKGGDFADLVLQC